MAKIEHKKVDDTVINIKLTIEKTDWTDKVNAELKNIQKNAVMPGFRKGKVPMSNVQQKYFEGLKVEEVQKIAQEQLSNYFKTKEITTLVDPQLKEQIDLSAESFNLDFEAMILPSLDFKYDKLKGIKKHDIVVDEEELEKEISMLQRQYGTMAAEEKIGEDCSFMLKYKAEADTEETKEIYIHFGELSKKGKEYLADKSTKDNIEIDTENHIVTTDSPKFKDIPKLLSGEIIEIRKIKPSELNEEFYKKVYNGKASNKEELVNLIKEQRTSYLKPMIASEVINESVKGLGNQVKVKFNKDFISKYLIAESEVEKEKSEKENEIKEIEKSLLHQVIVDNIIKQNDIKVPKEDMEEEAQSHIKNQFATYGLSPTTEQLAEYTQSTLKSEEDYKNIFYKVLEKKLFELLVSKVKYNNVSITYNKYVEEKNNSNKK